MGKGSHFCTPVLTNTRNITFQVLMLSTFVFNKCSEKYSHDFLCGYELTALVRTMLAQRRRRRWPSITSALGQCIVLSGVSGVDMLKRHQHNAVVRKHGTITQCCFNDGLASKTAGEHWTSIG